MWRLRAVRSGGAVALSAMGEFEALFLLMDNNALVSNLAW
jgi:hypothetical protein